MINTKWQYQCVKALATSPLAFYTFKLKQKNKKVLTQYISRLWPAKHVSSYNYYHVDEIMRFKNNPKTITQLINIYNNTNGSDDLNRFMTKHNIRISPLHVQIPAKVLFDKLLQFIQQKPITHNAFFNMSIVITDRLSKRIITNSHFGTPNGCLFDSIYKNFYNNSQMKRAIMKNNMLDIIISFSSAYYVNMSANKRKNFAMFIEQLFIFIKTKPKRYIKQSLNVGIEIEHDAEKKTSPSIKRSILRNGCKEYDSGFDADSDDRLRENRIRLRGIEGLLGLDILLNDMLKNAAIAKNSSVHMHIDCLFDNKYGNTKRGIFHVSQKCDVKQLNKTLQKILDLDYHFDIDWLRNNPNKMKFHEDFLTIEYRICKVNLNYSDYVIQILTWIHLTQSIKWGFAINIDYLQQLAKIQNEINKNH